MSDLVETKEKIIIESNKQFLFFSEKNIEEINKKDFDFEKVGRFKFNIIKYWIPLLTLFWLFDFDYNYKTGIGMGVAGFVFLIASHCYKKNNLIALISIIGAFALWINYIFANPGLSFLYGFGGITQQIANYFALFYLLNIILNNFIKDNKKVFYSGKIGIFISFKEDEILNKLDIKILNSAKWFLIYGSTVALLVGFLSLYAKYQIVEMIKIKIEKKYIKNHLGYTNKEIKKLDIDAKIYKIKAYHQSFANIEYYANLKVGKDDTKNICEVGFGDLKEKIKFEKFKYDKLRNIYKGFNRNDTFYFIKNKKIYKIKKDKKDKKILGGKK